MAWSSNDLVVYGQCVALIVVYISCVILGRPIGDGRMLLVDDSDELREFSTSILLKLRPVVCRRADSRRSRGHC
jgi:hypothetical protein